VLKEEIKMTTPKKTAQKKPQYKIKVSENGPYLVSGGIPLSEQLMCVDSEGQYHGWKEGKSFPAQENYALCRCGRSKNPPYCDGTHTKFKFDGTETASRETYLEQAAEIAGPGLKLTDAEDFCVGARFCHRAGGTWNLVKESSKPDAKKTAIE
jgi:CDGSH-type Zn-finger protein